MSWPSNPPPILTSLRTQLQASTAWQSAGGIIGQIHYPRGVFSSDDLPAAVITHEGRAGRRVFLGVDLLPEGRLTIDLYSDQGVDDIETLAMSIATQICTETGIAGLQVDEISPAEEADEAQQIAEGALNVITITLSYGLEEA